MSNNYIINTTVHISIGHVSKKLLDFSSRSSYTNVIKIKALIFFFPFYIVEKNISKATHTRSSVLMTF